LLSVLLLGTALRLHQSVQDIRFHSDEALYSTYARNAAVFGDWMLSGPLDKPPLSIYASALSMHFFAAETTDTGVINVGIRQGEFAARIPNVFAGIIAIALMARLASGHKTPVIISALIMAVSPYAVAYSASAFTDMLMLCWMLAALVLALEDRPVWSGLALALSFAAKPQGLLYLPLALWWLRPRRWPRFGVALATGLALLLLWDALRPETSLFVLGSINISQGRTLVEPSEWLSRLESWLHHGRLLLGPAWLTVLLTGVGTYAALRFRRYRVVGVVAVGFFLLHWLGAFYTFDRYLLPLVPLLALLVGAGCGRGIPRPYDSNGHVGTWHAASVLGGVFLTALIVGGVMTTHDPRADVFRGEDIIELADTLNALPLGTIIYDRWLDWEMGYYLGAWTDKRRVYYPTPEAFAADTPRNPDMAPRYLIAPVDREVAPWLHAAVRAGFSVALFYDHGGYRVYELRRPIVAVPRLYPPI